MREREWDGGIHFTEQATARESGGRSIRQGRLTPRLDGNGGGQSQARGGRGEGWWEEALAVLTGRGTGTACVHTHGAHELAELHVSRITTRMVAALP